MKKLANLVPVGRYQYENLTEWEYFKAKFHGATRKFMFLGRDGDHFVSSLSNGEIVHHTFPAGAAK